LTPDFFSGLKRPVDFFIVRHGQSDGNAAKILQGRFEYPLSEAGRAQSAARGKAIKAALSGTAPRKILFFSSPQTRARETAAIIAKETGLKDPLLKDELFEMSLGIWTGKSWDEVKNDNPALWNDFMARSWDAIPDAESSGDLYKRALCLWALLRDEAIKKDAEKVIAVTHGGLIQWIVKSTFRSRNWFPLLPISNCGQFKLCVEPRPIEKSAYLCWEEINSPIPDYSSEPRGFPS
jgi:broad specificity phosphatase PhoE